MLCQSVASFVQVDQLRRHKDVAYGLRAPQQLAILDSRPAVSVDVGRLMPVSSAAKSAGKFSSSSIRIGRHGFVRRIQDVMVNSRFTAGN
jgi:hypothetical protein